MVLNRIAATLVLAAALGATAAQAATAFASTSLNVRSGPGTGFPVVDVLRPGEVVDVEFCRGLWCHVAKSGPDGWVSANYLTQDYYDDDAWEDDGEWEDFYLGDRPHWRPFRRGTACVGGPNAVFCLGT